MASRVIWKDLVGFMKVVVDHPGQEPHEILTFEAVEADFTCSLIKTELKSLITALLSYEAELESRDD